MTVAIVASRDVRSDVRFAEGHRFSVVSVSVMRQSVLMTSSATFVAPGFEMISTRTFDLMRRMTIGTRRRAGVAFGHKLTVNALVIGLLDFQMALAAGLGDGGLIDLRTAVNAALDVVHPVAIIAGRSYNQSHLQQGPAVDAVLVLRG